MMLGVYGNFPAFNSASMRVWRCAPSRVLRWPLTVCDLAISNRRCSRRIRRAPMSQVSDTKASSIPNGWYTSKSTGGQVLHSTWRQSLPANSTNLQSATQIWGIFDQLK